MSDKYIEKFYDDILCKDIKILNEMLASLSSSYRLLVGAAEEFNRISLVHRHEAEDAIDRADELGDIIDDVERELKKLTKLYLRELVWKIEIQQLYNIKLSTEDSSKTIMGELIEDIIDKK
ncbi:MAG: hypothetical protein A2Y23_13900 [Clostridiales bacterium GWB2_37_7]|nr:MAG: hypothetical protein A2Y23_13900 [Clostridiales bacterium GWB2_37_7]